MKKIFFLSLVFFIPVLFTKAWVQVPSVRFQLEKQEYEVLKNYMVSKNLKVKDTIFIKYDFDHENCWNALDEKGKKYINQVIKTFQDHISDFNSSFETAVAYNFREPGKNFNKLKLWDDTIITDDRKILRKLIFKEKIQCGSSAVIFPDGSYQIYESDPHFELVSRHHHYSGKKF